ncbi:MAG: hypothetical protein JST20_09385 [Bacteroidetes bacterium]|nr:hypothetical protein [Bacteroidota bacterium]
MKQQTFLFLLGIILLGGCAPTFPIHALKKGEWGESASMSVGNTGSVNCSLGYGISDNATAYATVSDLLNYRLGLYYAVSHTKGFLPEIGINGYGGTGIYSWNNGNSGIFFGTDRDLQLSYGGLGLHSIWQVDSSGTLLYVVANNYYQPKVGYAFRPSFGIAIPVTAGGTLFQVDIQTPFLSTVTEEEWQPLKKHFVFGMGITF